MIKKITVRNLFKGILLISCIVYFVMSSILSEYALETENVAYDIVRKWQDYGIIAGDSFGELSLNKSLTKVEAITILNKINNVNIEIKEDEEKYKDVESFRWYFKEVEKAVATGLISGTPDGKVEPKACLSREQAFVMIAKLFDIKYKGNSDAKEYLSTFFDDGNNAGKWSSPYLAGLSESGYINGLYDNELRPKDDITKIEFLEVLDNIVGLLINKSGEYDLANVKGRVVINTSNVKVKNLNADVVLYLTAGSNEEVEILDDELIIDDDIPQSLVIGGIASNINYDAFKPSKTETLVKKLNEIKLSYIMPSAENLTSAFTKKYYKRVKGTDKWNDIILKMSKEEDVDPTFVKCIMSIESGGTAGVKSKMNTNGTYDYGLMQVNTGWGNSFNYQRMLTDNEYAVRCGIIVIKRKIEAAEANGKTATVHEVAWRYNGYSKKGYEYANILSTIYEELTGNPRTNPVRLDERLLKAE